MKSETFNVVKYEAEDGMYFDWKTPHTHTDEEGNIITEHLYAKVLFIGVNDSIDNYVEVERGE